MKHAIAFLVSFVLLIGLSVTGYLLLTRRGETIEARGDGQLSRKHEAPGEAQIRVPSPAEPEVVDPQPVEAPPTQDSELASLLSEYANIFALEPEGHDADARRLRREMYSKLESILRSIVANADGPIESIDNLVAALTTTPATTLGYASRNLAGGILSEVIRNDVELTEYCRTSFLENENPAVATMMISALLAQSGLDPAKHANLIDGFEHDMVYVAQRAEDENLRLTILSNLPRARNYEAVDEMLDFVFTERPDWIPQAAQMMERAKELQRGWREAGEDLHGQDFVQDSLDRMLLAAGSPDINRERLTNLMIALKSIDQERRIHDLRNLIREDNFDASYIEWLDNYLKTVPKPLR